MARKPARKPAKRATPRRARQKMTPAEIKAADEFVTSIQHAWEAIAAKVAEQAKTIDTGKAALAELESRFAALAREHAALRETAKDDAAKVASLDHDLAEANMVAGNHRRGCEMKQRTIDDLERALAEFAERERRLGQALRDTEHALGKSRIEAINLAEADEDRRLRERHAALRVNAEIAR